MKATFKAIAVVTGLTCASAVSAEMLPGSEWGPTEINGEAVVPVEDIFVRFEQDARVFGNAGCNTFRGLFVTNGEAILFGPAATTMMACPEDISRQEYAFLQALTAARHFERDGISLTLSDSERTVVLRLTQRDAD